MDAEPRNDLPELAWDDTDRRAVDTVRLLAADAVEKVGNGHPGTAMSLAPLAYLLYQRHMRHDPADPSWAGRDRFVLTAGHSSMTLYVQLYLSGYGLELDDLKALRTWGSKTPGHPEYGHTAGVETTTGPLGQGLATAVGMAMAARRERGLLDPDAAPGESAFDHTVCVVASDGDIQEGVTSEASSLAGHQELGNLVVVYDQNQISIEDDTDIALSEDVAARYEAYGWHVSPSTGATGGESERLRRGRRGAVRRAARRARREPTRPSFVVLRTVIAWPAPNAQDTGASHGSALGDRGDPRHQGAHGPGPRRHVRRRGRRAGTRPWGRRPRRARPTPPGDERYATWREQHPERAELLDRMSRAPAAGRVDRRPARVRGRQEGRDARGLGRRPDAPWPPCCRSCGAAPPTWPAATTRR